MIESRAERDPMLHYKVRELAIIGEELKLFVISSSSPRASRLLADFLFLFSC
jgi:hypothetical protein